MSEILRGHMEECLKHLAIRMQEACPKGSKNANELKRPMAEFCEVGIPAVTSWLYRGSHLPRGEEGLKAMFFLELNGYKVLELERMETKYRNFAKLIGFKLITIAQAMEMLGYSANTSLYRLFRDGGKVPAEKESKIWDMWKVRREKLDEAVLEASKKYRLDLSNTGSRANSFVPYSDSANSSGCPKDGVLDIMHGLLKMLDSKIMQDMTEDDWVSLRNSGGNTILRLSSHLSSMSAKLTETS